MCKAGYQLQQDNKDYVRETVPMSGTIDYQSANVPSDILAQREELNGKM